LFRLVDSAAIFERLLFLGERSVAFSTDKVVEIVGELHNRTLRAGLTAMTATGKALSEPDEPLPWYLVSREYVFLYCLLINLRAFRILGPERGGQFRTILRKVMASAAAKLAVEGYEQYTDEQREQLDAVASGDMDSVELEYGLAAPRPEIGGSWVWTVAGERIAGVLGRPSIVSTATKIAEEHWQTIRADELLARLR